MARLALILLLVAGCTSVPTAQPSGSGSHTPKATVSSSCSNFNRHQYEVCFAYVVNDTLLARVPWYKSGRSPDLGPAVKTRLESRFYGAARSMLEEQTRTWPQQVEVSPPKISIVGKVHVTGNLSTATIHTVETWLVRTQSGRVLFSQNSVHNTITLDRVPTQLCAFGHCLHKWVVVKID